MSPSPAYTCPHCHAASTLPGIRAFATVRCAHCGEPWRPRSEIGGFRLLDLRARSGLGLIFRALDPASGATLAVKLIRPPHGTEKEELTRFKEEAAILASLEHPHWVRVYAGGVEDDVAWLAMEWLPHGSLADLLAKRGRLTEIEALDFAAQAASALAAAHHAGLAHGDLEPNSLLFADPQTLKVSDFAQTIFYARSAAEVGTVWGRLCCIPPERLWREDEDERSDIYALGTILYHSLTGFPPHEGETVIDFMFERFAGPAEHVEAHVRTLHGSTAALVNRMLNVEPQRRFQSWDEVLDAIAETRTHFANRVVAAPRVVRVAAPAKRPGTRGGMWMSVLMLSAVLGVIGGFAWWKRSAPSEQTAQSTATAPVAVAIPTTPPPPKAAPQKATAPGMDWKGWKEFILESPLRKGGVTGSANFPGGGKLRLIGNSSGVAGTTDENVFYAKPLPGNWTLLARIATNTGTAGLAARENGKTDCISFAVAITADGKLNTFGRTTAGAPAASGKSEPAAKQGWLRLMRRGAIIMAHYSADGKTWREVGAIESAELPATIPAGFVVWSGRKETAAATFENVALTLDK